jgi:DNA-binding transcriptional regulator YhcF (GntR family)
MQTRGGDFVLLQLDFSGDIPIYIQIRNQVVLGIADGRLPLGEKLPTIRALADESGINMMTVNKAYQLLKQEGYIAADRRSGAVVISGGGALQTDISEKAKSDLKLLISEAKLKGISKDAFIKLVCSIYDRLEV